MKKIDEKLFHFIKEYELINNGDKILIALSGGPDSVFMLHFLHKYKKKYRIEIGALHVNHMIRGKDADEDEKFCKKLCLNSGIDYFAVKRNVPAFAKKNKISVEQAAREIRYRELIKFQKKYRYDKIATGHNCSDNVETVLLNMIKGAGIKGLSGIPIRRENIVRPILSISKNEILEYLKKNNVNYVIDKTNISNAYERNFIRNEIIPKIKQKLNPQIEQTIFKSSLILKKQSSVLQTAIKIIAENVAEKNNDELEISINGLYKFDREIWSEILKFSIEHNFSVQITFNDCSKIILLLSSQVGKCVNISNGLAVLRERDYILIYLKQKSDNSNNVEIMVDGKVKINEKKITISSFKNDIIPYSNNKNIEYIDAEKVSNKFILRTWKDGDRFYPLGLNGSKKVSDFLNDQKISSYKKREQLVLINNKKIVWVVGYRIDNRYRITDKTRKVLKLCLK